MVNAALDWDGMVEYLVKTFRFGTISANVRPTAVSEKSRVAFYGKFEMSDVTEIDILHANLFNLCRKMFKMQGTF